MKGKKIDFVEDDNIWKSIPVASYEDLEVLELKLQNENVYNQMIQHLERLGGKDFRDCLRRFLKRLLNDNVASIYSLHGHKKKESIFQVENIFRHYRCSTEMLQCNTKRNRNNHWTMAG